MDRKKMLRDQYKQMKHEMGIFIFECIPTHKVYVGWSQNLKAVMNGVKFKLEGGFFPNRRLLADWKEYGESNFNIEVIETMEYDKDESKTDYSEELEILREICKERYENAENLQ